jgi:hypothetical protein
MIPLPLEAHFIGFPKEDLLNGRSLQTISCPEFSLAFTPDFPARTATRSLIQTQGKADALTSPTSSFNWIYA